MQNKISKMQLCVYLLEPKKKKHQNQKTQNKTKKKTHKKPPQNFAVVLLLSFLAEWNNCCTLNLIEFIHLTEDHVILYAISESEEIITYKWRVSLLSKGMIQAERKIQ